MRQILVLAVQFLVDVPNRAAVVCATQTQILKLCPYFIEAAAMQENDYFAAMMSASGGERVIQRRQRSGARAESGSRTLVSARELAIFLRFAKQVMAFVVHLSLVGQEFEDVPGFTNGSVSVLRQVTELRPRLHSLWINFFGQKVRPTRWSQQREQLLFLSLEKEVGTSHRRHHHAFDDNNNNNHHSPQTFDLELLFRVCCGAHLRFLDLSNCGDTNNFLTDATFIAALRHTPNVQYLDLRCCDTLGDAAVCFAAEHLRKQLRYLNISSMPALSDRALKCVAANCAESLRVFRCAGSSTNSQCTPAGLCAVIDSCSLLECLDISLHGCCLDEVVHQVLRNLEYLQRFDCSSPRLTVDGSLKLGRVLRDAIRSRSAQNRAGDPRLLSSSFSARTSKTTAAAACSGNHDCDDNDEHAADYEYEEEERGRTTSSWTCLLTHLNLGSFDLTYQFSRSGETDVALARLLRHCPLLVSLNLFITAVGDNGLRVIARCCPLLEELDLYGCTEYTKAGLLDLLSHGACTSKLRRLDLGGSAPQGAVTDQCVKLIALKCVNLESLHLDSFDVTTSAICNHLARGCTKLVSLQLRGCSIEESDVATVESVLRKHLRCLESLRLR